MSDTRNSSPPSVIFLKDYQVPQYLIENITLYFDLREENTRVKSHMKVKANPAGKNEDNTFVLDGNNLTLNGLKLNGNPLAEEQYQLNEDNLFINNVPTEFDLEVETVIQPQDNTSLEGLYKSSGNFCTQCEAQGFRRITYFPDRPDVLTEYTVRIEADVDQYPVLLSNGNRLDQGKLTNNRHWVQWHDPFPKPSYLFALVAGDLACVENSFKTMNDRQVSLQLYVQQHNLDKCEHALRSLQNAMAWDEKVYGREYDLDLYMIVAVDDFNMGAMENKGLNVFNSSCVLAKPDTATDADYQNIERIVAHEYFHNWSGNRVTCRDWFQLSLKEGFTVFRDQEFSADMTSRAVKRISDVNVLRTHQFREDAGPMAHPVRPESYEEINNFYTVTVYNKGAEVVRMICNLLGQADFRKGTDLYFERHDGQAVTTDDFVQAMEDASGVDLTEFRRWYSQAGTPEINVIGQYNEQDHSYVMKVSQHCESTGEQAVKQAFHIPLAMALLDGAGNELPLKLKGEKQAIPGTRILSLTETLHEFEFVDLTERPVMSLLRDFSAPVKLVSNVTAEDKMFLMAHDGNAFNRWDVGQGLLVTELMELTKNITAGSSADVNREILGALQRILSDERLDYALISQAMSLPAEAYVSEFMDPVQPLAIHAACRLLRQRISEFLYPLFLGKYHTFATVEVYSTDAVAMGKRGLKNTCLSYLMESGSAEAIELCESQYKQANNMTDRLAALVLMVNSEHVDSSATLDAFYHQWKHDQQVVEKWIAIQSSCRLAGNLQQTQALMDHPAFSMTNPNKVRALIGGFAGSRNNFHQADGSGYEFVTQNIICLNDLNPQVAARLVTIFSEWRRFASPHQLLMKNCLETISSHPGLSRNVHEIVMRSLQ